MTSPHRPVRARSRRLVAFAFALLAAAVGSSGTQASGPPWIEAPWDGATFEEGLPVDFTVAGLVDRGETQVQYATDAEFSLDSIVCDSGWWRHGVSVDASWTLPGLIGYSEVECGLLPDRYWWRLRTKDRFEDEEQPWTEPRSFVVLRGRPPFALDPPAITGTPEFGATLTVSTGEWFGTRPLNVAYEWQRCGDRDYAVEIREDEPSMYLRLGDAPETAEVTEGTGLGVVGAFRNGVAQESPGGLVDDGDGAARFDGVDDVVELPDTGSLDLGDLFTLEAWVAPAGVGRAQFLSKGAGSYSLLLSDDNKIVLAAQNAGEVARSTVPVPADGGFHHVVAVKQGGGAHVYLDGVDVTGATAPQATDDTAAPLLLGGGEGAAPAFAGGLDEVALYSRALTAGQIRAHFDLGSAGCSTVAGADERTYTLGAADYGSTVRARVRATNSFGSAAALSAMVGAVGTSVPVNLEPPVVWGEPSVGRVLTAGENEWAGPGLSFGFQWQACAERQYRALVLADGPRAYWRLADPWGTYAADESDRGNAGTYSASVGRSRRGALEGSGDTNAAAAFGQTYMSASDASSLDLGDSFTLEAWVKPSTYGVRGQIVQKGLGGYTLRIDTDDRLYLAKAGAESVVRSSLAITDDGAFHHVVATKSGGTARVYVDGADVTVPLAVATAVNNNAALQVARFYNPQTNGSANFFHGELDEVAVYAVPLSAARVKLHHQMGATGCADIPGAVGTTYVSTDADAGTRLRVRVDARASNGSTATAHSAQTVDRVVGSGDPVIAAGTLTGPSAAPIAGATVSLLLWPAPGGPGSDVPPGQAVPTTVVATTTTDASGSYVFRTPVTPAIQAAADANGGIVNLEIRAVANGLTYTEFLEREFSTPATSLGEALGSSLADAEASWHDSRTSLPTAPTVTRMATGEPGVAASDPPGDGHGIPSECQPPDGQSIHAGTWFKLRDIGYRWARVGEIHRKGDMTVTFQYGRRADTHLDIAFKPGGGRWGVRGSIGIANLGSHPVTQSRGPGNGPHTAREVRAPFWAAEYYQCGTGNRKIQGGRWEGTRLDVGGTVADRWDGHCLDWDLADYTFGAGQTWTRDYGRAITYSLGFDLGFIEVGARTGYSPWASISYRLGHTIDDRTLCGITKPPFESKRIYAGG